MVKIHVNPLKPGADPREGQRGQLTPLQSHIREVKRMMYKYKNTLKCTIS